MNDHDHELFPAPPVEPMDDATRARLRARVLDGLDDAVTRRPRSHWVVPAAVAAAVLVIGGVAAGLVLRGDPEAPGGAVDPAASTSPPPSADRSEPALDPRCEREVRSVLRGTEPVVTTSSETGSTTFYVAGQRWTLCSTHGGRATVHQPGRLDAPANEEQYGVSSLYSGRGTSTYVAGGPLPAALRQSTITYLFPDAHEERSNVVIDREGRAWWQMEYTVTGGPLNRGNQLRLDPIRVVVSEDDVDLTYELDWALDTCRQANHGC